MKKALVLIAVSIAALSACQKSTTSTDTPTTYRVDGVTDITISADSGSSASAIYTVNYIGPLQETVTLDFEGLPNGIMVDTAANAGNIMTGIPSFAASITLRKTDTSNIKGTYNIKLTCTGSKTGKKFYMLRLKVLPKHITPSGPSVCDSVVTGTWDTCSDLCFSNQYVDILTADGSVINRVHFSNFKSWGIDVYGDLNCDSGTVVIPYQTFGGGTAAIWGSGTFSNHFIGLSVTDSSALGVNSCAVTMSR